MKIQLGIILKCKPKHRDPKRAKRLQKWCLLTRDGKRVLGRHPTRKKALSQERLIQMKKRARRRR